MTKGAILAALVGFALSGGLAGWAPAAQGDAVQVAAVHKVNVNQASTEELMVLPGVGEKTAQAIEEYRQVHGPFRTLDDLLAVKGIGEKKLAALRDRVSLE